MERLDVESLIKTATEEIEKALSTKTIVGEPMTFEGKTIIPVSKIAFGFGAGGGSGGGKGKKERVEKDQAAVPEEVPL